MKAKIKNKIIVIALLTLFAVTTGVFAAFANSKSDYAPPDSFIGNIRDAIVHLIDKIFEPSGQDKKKIYDTYNAGLSLVEENPTVHKAWEGREAAARQRSHEQLPLIEEVFKETPSERQARLAYKLTIDDIPQRYNYFVMDSDYINKDGDWYGPVRFMHKKHASITNDCTACHHYRPADPNATETMRCSACHQQSFNKNVSGRIGLKGAIHRQCVNCHKQLNKGPAGCANNCHERKVLDHNDLVKLPENPNPMQVTEECLRCHPTQGEEMLQSTHWLWKGPSPYTQGQEKSVALGKATVTVNNFCVGIASNWPRCTGCHAGYGWKDASFDFTDKTKIDCLVCHDTTGSYKKDLKGAGMPETSVDLVKVAKNVGKPSRKTCGACHFSGGNEDFVRHGKLNTFTDFHASSCDVHMGGLGFQCHDCHKTRNHKIAGRSIALPVSEGSRSCADCHTEKPHQENNMQSPHLNKHCDHLACVTCHNPVYAKCTPTKTHWDWSTAGDKNREVIRDEHGMPDYDWQAGDFKWGANIKPEYAWYNGKVKRYLLGDPINPDGDTLLNSPAGDIRDIKSKIYPFTVMGGTQAADAKNNYLLVPHLAGAGGFWENLDWEKALAAGTVASGLAYSGEFKWVETKMYLSLNHEVLPKIYALSCVQCHGSLKEGKSCGRCHQDNRKINFNRLAFQGIDHKLLHSRGCGLRNEVEKTDYINFKALGYEGDPIIYGGRFKKLPLGYREASNQEGQKNLNVVLNK